MECIPTRGIGDAVVVAAIYIYLPKNENVFGTKRSDARHFTFVAQVSDLLMLGMAPASSLPGRTVSHCGVGTFSSSIPHTRIVMLK